MPVRRPLPLLLSGLAVAVAATALTAVVLPGPLSPARAQEAPAAPAPGITVAGVGTVNGTPDVLRLSLRLVVQRPAPDTALRDAGVLTGRVRTALRGSGVAAADLQTTQLSVSPAYGGRPARIVGYSVVQGLSASLHDLGRAGQAVSLAVAAGGPALRLDGLGFSLSDDSPLKVKARDAAFAQAKAEATQYAALAGRPLGPVQQVSEDVVPSYGGSADSASAAPAAGGLPIDPGTQRVDVRVVVRWALG